MLRFDLPDTDTALVLTPRFGSHSAVVQVILLLLCLLPVVLVGWLYRYELRLVRRSVARVLLGLRLLVVLMLVFVLTFQPVAAHTTSESLPGRVVVALDRSDSMSIADPQRPIVEKLRLARALHLVRDLCSDADLDGWIRQADRSGQVQWPMGRTNEDERRRFDQVCQRIDALTRAQIARAVLGGGAAGLLPAIDRRHRLELLGFAGTGAEIDPAKLDTLQSLGDAGAFTDLRVPLGRGLDGGADRGKALAVVVLTDGQHNDPTSPIEKAAELGQQSIPVYAVAIGAKAPPTDIAVTSVQAPTTIFKGSDANVEAHVEVRGLTARTLEVELQRKDQPPRVESIVHDGSDRGYTVRFAAKLDEVGTQVLTVHARPAVEELRTENNSRPVAVNVADDKARVLVIDGEARWEYHYLTSALARDRGMDLKEVLFEQPRTGRLGEAELRAAGHPARSLPPGPDALERFDCIILGDVTPQELPPEDRVRLERFVGERGGTLVVLAGRRAMPIAYLGSVEDPLRKLLPIESAQIVQARGGFPVALSAEGKEAGFLRMEPTAEESERRWAALPNQFWGVAGRVKPAATVLATYESENKADLAGPGEWARNHALIARQSYGFGRVLFVGLDGTWRWRLKTGDTYHHRFWGQVIRWAASDAPLLTGNDFVRFGPRKPITTQGEDVEIGVRFGERAKRLPPGAAAALRLFRLRDGQAAEPAGQMELQPVHSRTREMEAKLRDLAAGRYAVELVIPHMAEQLIGPDGSPLRATFAVSARPSTEMSDLATNVPLLEEIAAKSGGQVFTAENAADLAELLSRRTAVREYRTETKLWQAWPTLAAFLALLTLEWLARKWAGLP